MSKYLFTPRIEGLKSSQKYYLNKPLKLSTRCKSALELFKVPSQQNRACFLRLDKKGQGHPAYLRSELFSKFRKSFWINLSFCRVVAVFRVVASHVLVRHDRLRADLERIWNDSGHQLLHLVVGKSVARDLKIKNVC